MQCQVLITVKEKAFENIVGTGENGSNPIFFFSPQWLLTCQRQKSSVKRHFICHLQNAINLDLFKLLWLDKDFSLMFFSERDF